MAQRPHVPKFGNWEGGDNVPYTVYFDKARKDRNTGGKMINPNDPQENPDMFSNSGSPAQAPPSRTKTEPEEPRERGAVRPTHVRRSSRDDTDSAHQRRGSNSGRPARQSAGSEQSIERSPLHPHYQAKLAAKGSASPGWEGKNSNDGSHGTPGRSRLRQANRGDETPDRGAAVPKFGDWDENNPSSADGYTHIFNRVREERNAEGGKSPAPEYKPYTPSRKQNGNGNKACGCFPWG